MKMNLQLYLVFLLLLLSSNDRLFGLTRFEDIDKNPVGSYGGQIFFGGTVGFGLPVGGAIQAENDFVDGTTYTFTEQEITKTVVINHLGLHLSAYGEYVIYERYGARLTIQRNSIIQRTNFGKDYKNESHAIFEDTSVLLGPTVHTTIRQNWDVVLALGLGASFGSYTPARTAHALLENFEQNKKFDQTVLCGGAEIFGVYYFKNGGFLTASVGWTFVPIEFSRFNRETSTEAVDFNSGSGETDIHMLKFSFGGGYALYH